MKSFPLKQALPYIAGIIIFVLISVIYMSPLLEGKKLRQDDIMRHKGMSKEITDFRDKTGDEALWTNSMFGGMPAYQISVKYKANLVRYVDQLFRLGLPIPADLIFLYMAGFFLLLIVLRVNPWLAIVGAIAYGFSSYYFIILEAGHNSKAHAIGYMAPVIAGIILTYRGKYIAGGILTLLFMALEIRAGHPQITYYLMLLLLVFGITEFVKDIRNKNLKHFAKASVIVIIAAMFGALTHITNLWATYEYGKYTIRGKTELSSEQENRTSGLDKDYATQWSYGVSETFTLAIPNFKGGASGVIGDNENALDKVDNRFKEYVAGSNQYWGNQPFTSGPVYAGAIVFFLFILGLIVIKGDMKWWLLAGTLLSIMLSWGKNFMPLTDFFLEYFPMYNKFRAVSMTLVIAELTLPLLAMLALNKMITEPDIFKRKVNLFNFRVNAFYLSLGFTLGLMLIFLLFPKALFDFLSDQEVQSIAQQKKSNPEYGNQIDVFYSNLEAARLAIFKADTIRSLLFILVAGAALWAFSAKKINKSVLIVIVGALILVDMWTVNKRYLDNDDFVRSSRMEKPFPKTAADEAILKDNDPNFRVLNLTVDPFADASTSYYHKSIGGYHGAKLRRYQELYDHQIKGKFNRDVLNMLNTKYIIQPGEDNKPMVVPNPAALGNAWFVNDIEWVENADQELAALDDFDPEKTAVIDNRFEDKLEGFQPQSDSMAQIKLITYEPNHLQYQSNTKKDQFAVFSEIYYPKGWNAYVDGEKVPHVRVNFVLRGMVIPAGKHLVEFKFEPKVFSVGEKVSFATSLLLILVVVGYGVMWIRKYFVQQG
ncbi:MAG: YfhO family protein [Bacteroidales bacterium]|nr:YfhO family protein [Bacteroidales bacterium]